MRWYWMDRFIEFESGQRAKSVKTVTLAEDHLHDHFPGFPVMPNSLVIEGIAQTGGLLVCEHNQFREKVVLAKVSRARFYGLAVPGDTLTYTAIVADIREDGGIVSGTSHKGDQLHAEMELFFAHLSGDLKEKAFFGAGNLIHLMRLFGAYDVGHAADGSPLREPGKR